MGKSGYKKFVKKERAKVKLKGSKTLLPKGQNVTDTNFKVKKIVIKDQIKLHQPGEILSTRKLNLKELLSRLGHYNVSMKFEALAGLTELVMKHADVILTHNLVEVTNRISELTIDNTPNIRKEANKLLSIIFSVVPTGQLTPVFPSLFSYLKCGLTHIDAGVRSDSLVLLDSLLAADPKACIQYSPDLLLVCLDLVSRSGGDTARSLLALSLDSKLTADKWRAKVLARVRTLLSAMANSSTEDSFTGTSKADKCEQVTTKGTGGIICIKVFPNASINPFNVDFNLSYSKISVASNCVGSKFDIQEFSEVLIPILLDTFIEAVPKENKKGLNFENSPGRLIDVETAALLQCIADIVLFLWKIIVSDADSKGRDVWMREKFTNLLMDRLVSKNFPYSATSPAGMKKRKKKNAEAVLAAMQADCIEPECFSANISLAKLIILFGERSLWAPAISYIKNCMRAPEKLGASESLTLASCIFEICQTSGSTKSFDDARSLVSVASTIGTVSSSKTVCHLADALFWCLANIATDRELSFLHSDPNFEKWLASLPKMLTNQTITQNYLEAILLIAKRQFPAFTNSLDGLIEVILHKLTKITVTNMDKAEAALSICNLLYWVEEWDEELLDGLQKGVENNYWGESLSLHIKEIVSSKLFYSENTTLHKLIESREWWTTNYSKR